MKHASTLGKLKKSGWVSRTVKQEIRENAVQRIREGSELFPGVLGYDQTVIPQLENALLAGHDFIFLGERGQAKTRMIRGLVDLLDEWMPIIAGSEINDDPFNPVSKYAKTLIEERGDGTPIHWIHRSERFGEKLATPDTAIADLIGEVDPIKVAEGRYLSDELTLHYGLVPRTNRGIFAINELPDLSERIQVGLLNVLEERDVQVRGYKIRLPLDILLVASANPEDYTNRGRIITPLKDRFGSQLRTHYPFDIDLEAEIAIQEAEIFTNDDIAVTMPDFMSKIIATVTHAARESAHINQRSGVSVRVTVANYESLIAGSVRRSTAGKIEVESLDDGRENEIIQYLIKQSVLEVFKETADQTLCSGILKAFTEGAVINAGDDIAASTYVQWLEEIPAFVPLLKSLGFAEKDLESPAMIASGMEFILEGLHLNKLLNKEAVGDSGVYRARA